MKKIIHHIIFIGAVLSFFDSYATNHQYQEPIWQEDSLSYYFSQMANERDDNKKELMNEEILTIFRKILAQDESFDYNFSSLKYIGNLKSDDDNLRIITWNLAYYDGTHQYFGFIQFKKNRRTILTYELNDQSEHIKEPEFQILSHKNWYGALYYQIIVNKHRGNVFYTLLGSDLNDLHSKKKVIEILQFDNDDQPVFGAQVFKNREKMLSRVIFEYNAQVNMGLNYDESKQMIVYDHLSPFRASLKEQYQFYGPDFSYDGLKFENGIWNTYHDIDVRNYNID
ncbi:MAG: hypothetical protein R6V23_11205 [Bacteroidales bacterium]